MKMRQQYTAAHARTRIPIVVLSVGDIWLNIEQNLSKANLAFKIKPVKFLTKQ